MYLDRQSKLNMPVNKNALLRYRVIDACLTNSMHPYPNITFILDKLEENLGNCISESMFNKDIQAMKNSLGAPIKFHRQRKGYYYTEENFSLREFPLNQEEIDALDYSTALLHQLKGTRLFQQFENAINKVIEGYRASKILNTSNTQILQVEEPVKTEGSEWLEVLLNAIILKSCLQITYQGYGKEAKQHIFSPYLVKEYRNRWYAVGFSNRTENILVLAFDRIKSIGKSEEKYTSQENFSADEFFKYSFGITQIHDAKPEEVVLSIMPNQAPYILSQPLHSSQKILMQNERELQVQMEVYITQELKMAILSFGKNVKVLKPKSLQKEMISMIRDMTQLYN